MSVERFFANKVGQIKPVLDKVDAQHTFKSNLGTAIVSLRVVRFYHGTQISPRHDAAHRVQEFVAPCRPMVLFKSQFRVSPPSPESVVSLPSTTFFYSGYKA